MNIPIEFISGLLGFILFPFCYYILYKIKGWDKQDLDNVELKLIINKAYIKIDKLLGDQVILNDRVISDLKKVKEILEGEINAK